MSKQVLFLLVLMLMLGQVSRLMAEESVSDSKDTDSSSSLSIPAGLENKDPLSAKDLAKKKEGTYFTGLPLLNSDPDTGIGYGARVFHYNNGERSAPLFRYTPYFYKLYVQYFATTNGMEDHGVTIDLPYIGGSLFRLTVALALEKNITENYFGTNSRTLSDFKLPAELQQKTGKKTSYSNYEAYHKELSKINEDGSTYARYHQYLLENPSFKVVLDRDLVGGVIKLKGGVTLTKVKIEDYSGKRVEVDGDSGIMGKSKLREDFEAGLIRGIEGGWDNTLQIGLGYDTRDFEPAPNTGTFTDMLIDISSEGMGSDFEYTRYTFTSRGYFSPFAKTAEVVFAARGLYSEELGEIPFFAQESLGGVRTLRGYRRNRFVGDVRILANFEVRWDFMSFSTEKQHFEYLLVPFVDFGKVFDQGDPFNFEALKQGQGVGFRIAWNQATIIILDYGLSPEDSGFYANFRHIF
ncbi:DUF5982 domain-containing protein [Deltaproteobacteria bacterium TL4]